MLIVESIYKNHYFKYLLNCVPTIDIVRFGDTIDIEIFFVDENY